MQAEEALSLMRQRKAYNTGSEAAGSGLQGIGAIGAEGLRLRSQLQRAVEEERCGAVQVLLFACRHLHTHKQMRAFTAWISHTARKMLPHIQGTHVCSLAHTGKALMASELCSVTP